MVTIGDDKTRPRDYLAGRICRIDRGGNELETVSRLQGNYMGYIDIDGRRYFDVRDQKVQPPLALNAGGDRANGYGVYCLESDSTLRIDSLQLQLGDVVQAQTNKEELERLQRHDRALREAAEKRRQKNGPKIVYNYKEEGSGQRD